MVVTLLYPVYTVAASSPVSARETVLALSEVNLQKMPRVENSSLVAAAERREANRIAVPYHFAHPFEVDLDIRNSRTWEALPDGSSLWRLRVASTSAGHINLGFSQFQLPRGAELWIYNAGGGHVRGPFSNDNRSNGKLSIGWEGGGTPETRLRDWLDPLESGATSLQGLNQLSKNQQDIATINKFGLAAMVILLAFVSVSYFRLRI